MPVTPKIIGISLGTLVVAALAVQLVPYGRDHQNPPVVAELAWDSPQTRELAKKACFDCHSHETTWPWYANVAPASWLLYNDVQEGRKELNFSDWRGGERKHENMKDIIEEMDEGEMPPLTYRISHREAQLTPAEKEALLTGLKKSVPAERHPKFRK